MSLLYSGKVNRRGCLVDCQDIQLEAALPVKSLVLAILIAGEQVALSLPCRRDTAASCARCWVTVRFGVRLGVRVEFRVAVRVHMSRLQSHEPCSMSQGSGPDTSASRALRYHDIT